MEIGKMSFLRTEHEGSSQSPHVWILLLFNRLLHTVGYLDVDFVNVRVGTIGGNQQSIISATVVFPTGWLFHMRSVQSFLFIL